MATSYLTNHLYPDNPHLLIVDLKQVVKRRGEPNTDFNQDNSGEHFWEVTIYTSGLDSEGDRVGPFWVDVVGSETTVDELISEQIKAISNLIDWTKSPVAVGDLTAGTDTFSPFVYFQFPERDQVNVPIDTRIILRLREHLPAKGIDSSTVVMKVDGFTITPDIHGNPYDTIVSFRPKVGE